MSISAISALRPSEYVHHIQGFPEPLNPKDEVKRKDPKEYTSTTIKGAENEEDVWACIYPEAAGMFLPWKHQMFIDKTATRPELEPPSFNTVSKQNITKEVNEILAKLAKSNPNDMRSTLDDYEPKNMNIVESQLMRVFVEIMKTQIKSQETSSELAMETMQQNEAAKKKITEECQGVVDKKNEQNKKINILKWVKGFFFGFGLLAGGLGIGVAVVGSGGAAALPAAIAIANALAAIGAGSSGGIQAYYTYENKKLTGSYEEKNHQKRILISHIKDNLHTTSELIKRTLENWQQVRELQNNFHNTATTIIK